MKVEQDSIVKPPSQSRIEKLEEWFQVKFPRDYKDWIFSNNGAVPVTNTFYVGDYGRLIERFLPILDDPNNAGDIGWYDIDVVASRIDTRLIDDEDIEEINVIPIAALFAGDYVCLDFRSPENPKIVVWNHEVSEDFKADLTEVAANFTEFLSILE